jgi:hypothetical protein
MQCVQVFHLSQTVPNMYEPVWHEQNVEPMPAQPNGLRPVLK